MGSEEIHYQQRGVAFVDVLGFENLVASSEVSPTARAKINKLISVDDLFDRSMKILPFTTATFFSDSFVLSTQPDQLIYLVREIGYLCRHLLLLGLPCIGAISVGSIYHQDRIVVGPALVKAHQLEQCAAIYPRVVLDDAAMKYWKMEFSPGSAHPHLESLIKHDIEGRYFIDIFNREWGRNFIPPTDIVPSPDTVPIDAAAFHKAAYEQIRNGLTANMDNPKVRMKYEWLGTELATTAAHIRRI